MSELDIGTQTSVAVSELTPHSKNEDIYFVDRTGELETKIEEHGFLPEHRLLVTSDKRILSGHRRWKAAKNVGLDTLPVEVVDCDSETEELERILLANKYREKTPGEIRKEKNAWEDIEEERAKDRQGERTDITQHVGEGEQGEAREKIGEKIGVSAETVRRIDKVEEKAEKGNETAKEQLEKLDSGEQSIRGAYQEVKESEKEDRTVETKTPTPNAWISTETKDVEVQAKRSDSGITVCVNGTDYEIGEDLYEELFKGDV